VSGPKVLWERGRLSLLFEPRDCWLLLFIGPDALYFCLAPCLPIRRKRAHAR
jgi:hypothetical protein